MIRQQLTDLLKETGENDYEVIKYCEVTKYWCNNWRKRNNLPMRRKGSSLIKLNMKFEHKTTKKQKKKMA